MSKPRRPRDHAATPPNPSFSAAEALEAFHTEIVDIEAFAHAAGEAVTHLPHTTNPKLRRIFARVYTLVTKVATDLNTAVRHGDQLIAALSQLQRRSVAEPATRRPELPGRRAGDE